VGGRLRRSRCSDDLAPLTAALDLVDRSPGQRRRLRRAAAARRAAVARRARFAGCRATNGRSPPRGKLEVIVLAAAWTIAYDLAKLSWT